MNGLFFKMDNSYLLYRKNATSATNTVYFFVLTLKR